MGEAQRGPECRTYLVERYWPGVDSDDVAAAIDRLQSHAETRHDDVLAPRHLASVLVDVDEVCLSILSGTSIDAIAVFCQECAVPFDRIVQVTVNPTTAAQQPLIVERRQAATDAHRASN